MFLKTAQMPPDSGYIAVGAGLLRGIAQTVTALAWASILLLVAGIRNTWDMVLWFMISRQEPPKQ